MPNYLKMPKKSQVLALLELGWSYRRIEVTSVAPATWRLDASFCLVKTRSRVLPHPPAFQVNRGTPEGIYRPWSERRGILRR